MQSNANPNLNQLKPRRFQYSELQLTPQFGIIRAHFSKQPNSCLPTTTTTHKDKGSYVNFSIKT